MSGMQHHGDLPKVTPEQIEEVKQLFEGSDEAKKLAKVLKEDTTPRPPRISDIKEYTVRKKRIYKGKMTPQGILWLVVKVWTKSHTYELAHKIPGGLTEDQHEEMVQYMIEHIAKHNNLEL